MDRIEVRLTGWNLDFHGGGPLLWRKRNPLTVCLAVVGSCPGFCESPRGRVPFWSEAGRCLFVEHADQLVAVVGLMVWGSQGFEQDLERPLVDLVSQLETGWQSGSVAHLGD